jgi:type I restriction enzyme M protein
VRGWGLVPHTARRCVRTLHLHGIDADPCPVASGVDSLAGDPGERFRLALTNPPFGKKSSIAIVTEGGDLEQEDVAYERADFRATTKNKPLTFLQHAKALLKVTGRCALVVPDNLLFGGRAGEAVRRKPLGQCAVHTLLRRPAGLFSAQGVKANVLFFDARPAREEPWTERRGVYGLRTNRPFTRKTRPLRRADRDGFVGCFHADDRHRRRPTWSARDPEGGWRCFGYEDLARRDKRKLNLSWPKDRGREDAASLPGPDMLDQEVADDLQTALEQFGAISEELKE